MSRGTVHDLGYKRYVGTRRPQSTRWRVIARHQLRAAWKGFWRFKLPLLLAVINTTAWGFLMSMDTLKLGMSRFFSGAPEDIMLAMSYTGLGFYDRIAFIVGLTIAAGAVANDAQSGAFQFYFARPVRPRDYVLGKLAGFWSLYAVILVAGPAVLAGVRLGMYRDGGEALAHLPLLAKVIAAGSLTALAYAAVTLAISALAPSRRYAYAIWAAYHLVIGSIVAVVGAHSSPIIAALDLTSCLAAVVSWMLHLKAAVGGPVMAAPYAIGGLVVQAAVGTAILSYVVTRGRAAGIGGS